MAEASEGAEKMHKDGQNQGSEADGQKQYDERPPTRRGISMLISRVLACNAINSCLPVDDAKDQRKRERDR
jgi:hypothetical protein